MSRRRPRRSDGRGPGPRHPPRAGRGTLDLARRYLPPERRVGGAGLDLLPKHAIMLVVGLRFRKLKSSMLQSIERGRRPEIDYMNGYVVDKGREAAIPTPANAALTAMVREIEAGRRAIAPDNLAELAVPAGLKPRRPA